MENNHNKIIIFLIIVIALIIGGLFIYSNIQSKGTSMAELTTAGESLCKLHQDKLVSVDKGGEINILFFCENTIITRNGRVVWVRGE